MCASLNPASAEPDVLSGNYWEPICKADSPICTGYVRGLLDMHGVVVASGRQPIWCEPKGVTLGQAIKVIVLHMDKHPAALHLPFAEIASAAMITSYPCKTQS